MLDKRGPLPGGPPRNQSIPLPPGGGHDNYTRIKDAVDIVEYASRFTELRGTGDTFRGACPAHAGDNQTAFCVYVSEQSWYCHTRCKRGGSVIDLVMARTKCSKWEAVVQLAEEYGVELRRGRSADWHTAAGAGLDLRLGLEDDVVEHLTERIFALYCSDYLDSIEDEDERDEAMGSLWSSCWRRAQDHRERARGARYVRGEVSEDAS